jgi:hypothetical protein
VKIKKVLSKEIRRASPDNFQKLRNKDDEENFKFDFIYSNVGSAANAQTAEVSVALNEQFFDVLLDAIFKNFNAPGISAGKKRFRASDTRLRAKESKFKSLYFRI